jgi:hypothetical protein
MRKILWKLVGVAIMAAAVAFTMMRPDIQVVRAAECPDASTLPCYCTFQGADHQVGVTYCYYSCYCQSGGGEPMYIEQTIPVYD